MQVIILDNGQIDAVFTVTDLGDRSTVSIGPHRRPDEIKFCSYGLVGRRKLRLVAKALEMLVKSCAEGSEDDDR
jgi:hypothetical protein